MPRAKKTRICLITCYSQPDYIRARTLRTAFGQMDEMELIVVKNKHTGILRYLEVVWKIIQTRFSKHPDIYFLTFRGYEMLPFVRLLTIGKPLIFDEFINFIEWLVYENHKLKVGSFAAKLAQAGYKLLLLTTTIITTDTPSHAKYSAELMKLPIDKYVPLVVSSDETIFKPQKQPVRKKGTPFTVFYYGLFMMPLQGLDYILSAMTILKDQNIKLVLIGGKESTAIKVEASVQAGARVEYKYRVPFEELATYMSTADICLGGPFGNTVQSQYVIGGKTYQFMNMGRPVIIGKNEESSIWTDKKNALIVEQANARQLADAILWAKDHPVELQKIAEASKKLYEQKLSNEVLIGELRGLLANKHIL